MTIAQLVKPKYVQLGVNTDCKKILFIINRHAGMGYQAKLEGKISDACKKHRVACTIEFTRARGHAIELTKSFLNKGFQQVVAVGGDGTMNEVAQGLIHTGIPMGIIPRGSGNGLARHLGISLNISSALQQLFESNVFPIDTFTVNGRLSLNVSGIGFDGHVTNLFGVESTRGLIGYITLTIKEFLRFQEFGTLITMNGKTINRNAFILAIANSSQYGNNARIAPTASICDGLLHINIVKKVPLYRLDFLYAFFLGGIERSAFCEIIETHLVEFKTKRPIAYHVDGEPCGLEDSFRIELHSDSLHVLVPDTTLKKI